MQPSVYIVVLYLNNIVLYVCGGSFSFGGRWFRKFRKALYAAIYISYNFSIFCQLRDFHVECFDSILIPFKTIFKMSKLQEIMFLYINM